MSDERWHLISRLYDEAARLAPVDRAPFLRKACGDDEALRAEIESLLLDDSRANALLEKGSHRTLIGQRIGGYEIRSLLGVGGMGEVYRARDPKLDRDVAIKVLPGGFASDSERLARFQREARLLASLNHPHIGGIYGFEDASGVPALVLELVEGDTLAERLAKGPMPVSEALHIARQIAGALETAHEHGVVHRDLKPANIKITPEGSVKVLDFGLAKAVQRADSPLQTTASHEGTIVGTPAYMSPEQARGKSVDRRADVWAFGCVMYEMLTGRVAFAAATVTDTLAAVLDREPDWSVLPDKTPPAIQRLLRRCLAKDPKLRLHDMGDAGLDLHDAVMPSAHEAPLTAHAGSNRKLFAGLAAGLALGAGVAAALLWRPTPETIAPSPGQIRFSIDTPPMPSPHSMAISPDGRSIAFTAFARANGPAMLFVRRIGSLDSQPVPGTEDVSTDTEFVPFWSPDSQSLGFHAPASGKLKVVDMAGGHARVLCDVPSIPFPFQGGAWNQHSDIVFSSGGRLYRVPAAGGSPALVAEPSPPLQVGLRWPQFLPDGRTYLYQAASNQPTARAVFVKSLDSGETTQLLPSESHAAFAPPHFLLFTRQRTLVAQRFDLLTLQLVGEPSRIVDGVLVAGNGRAAFAVSDAGVLAYRTSEAPRSLVWVTRNGNISDPIGALSASGIVRLSPDGTRVAFDEPTGNAPDDVYIYDIGRKVKFRLTKHPDTDQAAIWSPDGLSVAYTRFRTTDQGIYQMRADGATPEQVLVPIQPEPEANTFARDWGRDYVVYRRARNGTSILELWAFPLSGDRKPFRYLPRVTGEAALSPNGRWLAYSTDEGGGNQVLVRSFPDPEQSRHAISSRGGFSPRWSSSGRELFYIDSAGKLVAASVVTDGPFKVQQMVELFAAPSLSYDVAPRGERFIFNVSSTSLPNPPPINVIVNWQEELKQRVPMR
jgi:Tol biopolymer transport system component